MSRETVTGLQRTPWLAVCFLIDVAIVSLFAVAVFVIATGGTVLMLGDIRIRLRTIENPVWILTLLIPLRYVLRERAPFLARRRWSLSDLHSQNIALH